MIELKWFRQLLKESIQNGCHPVQKLGYTSAHYLIKLIICRSKLKIFTYKNTKIHKVLQKNNKCFFAYQLFGKLIFFLVMGLFIFTIPSILNLYRELATLCGFFDNDSSAEKWRPFLKSLYKMLHLQILHM